MKYITILIAILLCSCGTPGQETVKISNTLTVVTFPLMGTDYPDYKTGDSVIVWRTHKSTRWHINVHNDEVYENSLVCHRKGIIIK